MDMEDLYVYANTVRLRDADSSILVGTFSRHWAAVAAMIRYSQPEFKSLGGDGSGDLCEEFRMRSRIRMATRKAA
jgi:hypothetical protein